MATHSLFQSRSKQDPDIFLHIPGTTVKYSSAPKSVCVCVWACNNIIHATNIIANKSLLNFALAQWGAAAFILAEWMNVKFHSTVEHDLWRMVGVSFVCQHFQHILHLLKLPSLAKIKEDSQSDLMARILSLFLILLLFWNCRPRLLILFFFGFWNSDAIFYAFLLCIIIIIIIVSVNMINIICIRRIIVRITVT